MGNGIQNYDNEEGELLESQTSCTTGNLKYDISKEFFYVIDWHIFYRNKRDTFTKIEACAF